MDSIGGAELGLSALPGAIPIDGLRLVLSAWSGRGIVGAVCDLPSDPSAHIDWTQPEIERRAARVLLSKLGSEPLGSPLLLRLPDRLATWEDALPAAIRKARIVASTPRGGGVRWSETFRRFGWPANSFVQVERGRVHNETIIGCAWWVIGELLSLADEVDRRLTEPAMQKRLNVLRGVAQWPVFGGMNVDIPSAEVLRLLKAEGGLWRDLAAIGELLIRLKRDPMAYALELICPEPDLAWRVFHLAVVGLVLHTLKEMGTSIRSLRPIGDWGVGPAFEALWQGRKIDVWYEAGGLWGAAAIRSPYRSLGAGELGLKSLGADVAMVVDGKHAALFECKYYADKEAAFRDGYLQAVAYAVEGRLLFQGVLHSCIVLPAPQVANMHSFVTKDFDLTVFPAPQVAAFVSRFLSSLPPFPPAKASPLEA